ncbi:SNF2 family N-terminal domain containing protein [Hyaloscypha variabilis]
MASTGSIDVERSKKRRKLDSGSPAPTDEAQEDDVCFGMLVDIPVKTPHLPNPTTSTVPVLLDNSNKLRRLDGIIFGTLPERSVRIVYALVAVGCTAQLFCQNGHSVVQGGSGGPAEGDAAVTLCVTIYGPKSLSGEVGDWLADYQSYLQDPIHCDRNVRYENPHLLRGDDEEPVMTFSLEAHTPIIHAETAISAPNLFELLNQEHDLEETEQPMAVLTPLHSHQKQALTFMLKREQGLAFDEPGVDVWSKETNSRGKTIYTNTITGDRRQSEPPNFRSGLLADQMGLGKSLSMISLIAANQYSGIGHHIEAGMTPTKSTLLVVPLPLLQTWETQLSRHLHPNSLSWCKFHGPSKPPIEELGNFDVVITTYKTLALQWKAHKKQPMGLKTPFSLYWHRIILDEAVFLTSILHTHHAHHTIIAHIIQNRSAAITKAACAIEARHRWAVTGTPIQNRLTDLASLFQFLQIYPYSNPAVFDREILRSWQKNDKEGCLRIKTLVNFVTLYRTTAVISLPPRNDLVHYLDFNPAENQLYESTKIRTQQVVKDAIGNPRKGVYMNALQWLTRLRLICNHGTMQQQRMAESTFAKGSWTATKAQTAFKSMLDIGNALCAMCGLNLATLDDISANDTELPPPKLSECLHLVCGSCLTEETETAASTPTATPTPKVTPTAAETKKCSVCPELVQCRGYKVSFAHVMSPSAVSSPSKKLPQMSAGDTPTKVLALLASLKTFSVGEKSVVFSYWTYTLDLIESALISDSILYTRVDGQLSTTKRNEAIRKFQEDSTIQVILVSITCGGTGLDLTSGSIVYLMEPQWNPMMEEQALCRVHRMGQTKEVTTIRYRMKNSFEEKVVTIQERKKDLAALTFSNEKISEADVGAARLQYLQAAL